MFILRDMTIGDCLTLLECGNDEEAKKYYDPSVFVNIDSLEKWANDYFLQLKERTGLATQIIEQNGKVIGFIYFCYVRVEDDQSVSELGFVLHKNYRGLGIVTKAAKTMLYKGFVELNLDCIYLSCYPENLGTIGVAKKLGMSFDEYWFNKGVKIARYKITRECWLDQGPNVV